MVKFFDGKIVSNPGEELKIIYSPKVLDNGSIALFESGVENVQEFIDASRDSSEISNIVRRFQATGDVSLLKRTEGFYGDVTSMPNTLAGALQLQIDSNRLYDSLPTSVKEKFGNDKNKFFVQSGSKEWCEIMSDYLPDSMKVSSVSEVKDNAES